MDRSIGRSEHEGTGEQFHESCVSTLLKLCFMTCNTNVPDHVEDIRRFGQVFRVYMFGTGGKEMNP